MNTRANIALLPWWKRILHNLLGTPFADPPLHPLQLPAPKQPYNHEQALRDMLHKGISIGVKQSAVVYTCFCERHHIPLHETLPGVFVCMLCQTGPMQVQDTEPEQAAHPRLLSYLELKNPHPGIGTAKFRAVHLQKVRQG